MSASDSAPKKYCGHARILDEVSDACYACEIARRGEDLPSVEVVPSSNIGPPCRRYRIVGGTISEEWARLLRDRARRAEVEGAGVSEIDVPSREIVVWRNPSKRGDVRALTDGAVVGSYGGTVPPSAWPDLFEVTAQAESGSFTRIRPLGLAMIMFADERAAASPPSRVPLSVVSDDAAMAAGALAFTAGYASARNAPPEPGSAEWTLQKLAGREFPEPNGARDFLVSALAEERAARRAEERATPKLHARYQVTFILELHDDDGDSEADVEETVQSILDEAMRPADGEEWVVRDGLCLYDTLDVSAKFDGLVEP